ncbi:hypothetical protein DICSQDRAFT_153218 [Dichomitus squalens LYAD-421 SS1]|uniref:uncharacterized protein n=1 Tax=Dichomitus squalens (strain LYAD-421) TaxID=732165 RepID=UPI0004412B16|nr:uncharacterized protein DICSQDRAFT_153218 [Dichomitus squalens LYAD-421 SS1]EJF64098.1 hypothetical protein DICSQDRAFT_153218 [Dichomitus squalens LYAD-421 SS1]
MSRRHPGGRTLPENPSWIEFPRSDGSAAALPKNTTKVVDSEGQVNYMRPVDVDESLSIMWRVAVGSQLAIRMQLPEGPKYVLKSFPEGYQLYDHNKGPANAPRHDPYLCGSTNINRFRSTNEFIPHALWLMQDETMNRANCLCKYCTKQPQRIISDNMGLSQGRSASVPGALSSRTTRPRREPRELRDPQQQQRPPVVKPYAAVRRAPKPPKTLVGPDQYVSPERDLDIRTSLSYGEGQRPRWFRKGELIWCRIVPPIRGRAPEEDISFWPGLVDDVHIKTVSVPRAHVDGDVDMAHLYAEAADGNPALGSPPVADATGLLATAPVETPGLLPWTVSQYYEYKVKLLGTHVNFLVIDEQVLPYLAYAPSDSVLNRAEESLNHYFQTVSIEHMDRELEQNMFFFDPMEPEPQGEEYFAKYQRASPSFTLAIQIAASLALYWLPTDEWECTFVVPPPSQSASASRPHSPSHPSSTGPQTQAQPETLHSVIQQSLNQNASSSASAQVHEPESISMVGRHPRAAAPAQYSVKQTRFQGLWWGTERIWTDELVRLKIARCQFAPKGTDVIYPPAGPSASTLAELHKNPPAAEIPMDKLGASEKGLFMVLEGLFIVDVPAADGNGTTKECRASGVLYELVEHDWEEVVEENKAHEATETDKGNGKASESTEKSDHPHSEDPNAPPIMTQPSPLKPPPLPNPDPTVPIAETATNILEQTSPAAGAGAAESKKARSLSAQLSHPVLSTPYPLPPPPHGFRFRPILKPGHEVIINLSLISGRYYPGLLYHPQMHDTVQEALNMADSEGGYFQNRHLWAMEGLLPGVHQSMEPRHWKPSRVIMLQEADKQARERFRERWEETKIERLHPPEAKPDVNWSGILGDNDAAMVVDS